MPDPTPAEIDQVLRFVTEEIESVPELEALLLVWSTRPAHWRTTDLSKRLYISQDQAQALLTQLSRKALLTVVPGESGAYRYDPGSEQRDLLMARIAEVYRKEIVRISTLIHSKPSSAVRDFARAFRFTREKEK